MSNENVIARFEVLKAMNLLAKVTNNEEFYYNRGRRRGAAGHRN